MLKLEGKLLGPWVDELREAFVLAANQARCVRLDLSALTFVDELGSELLLALIGSGAEIAACSGYVAALLQIEERRDTRVEGLPEGEEFSGSTPRVE
jgi:hypothetical protein